MTYSPNRALVLSFLASLAAGPLACTNDMASKQGAELGTAATADAGDSLSPPVANAPCMGADDGKTCAKDKLCIGGHCVFDSCGDGFVGRVEECDDGNQVAGDGCDPGCNKERAECGDGKKGLGEECDDGNRVNDDACSNRCTTNACGNGRVELREECDDGNKTDTDKCSNGCAVNECGNGRVDPGEACDDGNKNDNDGCNNSCAMVRCGNGTKEGKEECDDGNVIDTDGCANACTSNVCGNMRRDPGEVCDGDVVGATCAPDCKSVDDVCRPCEELNCRSYKGLGIDLVAGCYENPDPTFVQRCVDVLSCTRMTNCAYSARGPEECYCGTAVSSDCQQGKGVNGVCKAQFDAAAGSTDPVFVTAKFGTRSLPIGNAVYMLLCDRDSCPAECTPGQ